VIVGGCAVVLEAMVALGFDRLTVSDRGVRWGLLHDRFGESLGSPASSRRR
jgi:exopolyphosphatase/guanosine-5'-triphosphate,3'-diphosphate pyrophosphatase